MRDILALLAAVAAGVMLGISFDAISTPAEDPIYSIDFETFSPGSRVVAPAIALESDVTVTGGLTLGGGIQFPDGTVQTTAATAAPGASANEGLYDNRIPEFTAPEAFIEVCFKAGALQFDIHTFGESTAGGSCVPGDVGWIIEREERLTADWPTAKATCLMQGMRLPEPFEFQYSCDNEALLGLIGMNNNSEWASNRGEVNLVSGGSGVSIPQMGGSNCRFASLQWTSSTDLQRAVAPYRCVR